MMIFCLFLKKWIKKRAALGQYYKRSRTESKVWPNNRKKQSIVYIFMEYAIPGIFYVLSTQFLPKLWEGQNWVEYIFKRIKHRVSVLISLPSVHLLTLTQTLVSSHQSPCPFWAANTRILDPYLYSNSVPPSHSSKISIQFKHTWNSLWKTQDHKVNLFWKPTGSPYHVFLWPLKISHTSFPETPGCSSHVPCYGQLDCICPWHLEGRSQASCVPLEWLIQLIQQIKHFKR